MRYSGSSTARTPPKADWPVKGRASAWASNRQAVPPFGPPTFQDLLTTLGLHPFEEPMGTLSAEITRLAIGNRHGFTLLKTIRPVAFFLEHHIISK